MSQHYRLPSLGLNHSYKNSQGKTTFEAKLVLRKEDLEQFSGWKTLAKQLLHEAKNDVDLVQIVETYHEHVMEFRGWFRTEKMRVHGIGPDILGHLSRHSLALPTKAVVAALRENLETLEQRDRSLLTFTDLYDALAPVLTEWDYNVLRFYEHNAQKWLQTAVGLAAA